jgi:predicted pyridoxine 5'-phosphate oxidase superfamily flavin-nucleotide-binding protein
MGAGTGFHAGEIAVQQRAGVRAVADRLAGMLDEPDLRGGPARFLAERTFAALSARDRAGRLWIGALTGAPGFLEVTGPAALQVRTAPGPPLDALPAGQPVGLLAIEFARRRRVRINGTLSAVGPHDLTIDVDQAYGNCPQYIHQRFLEPSPTGRPDAADQRRAGALSAADVALVRRSDTFLLGTTHPDRGNDASHRGGPAGFVRVEDEQTLWWPDYPGNNMFNSLGNLAVEPAAALLFVDFATGATLHLSGRAELDWQASADADDVTGRRVRFTVEALAAGDAIPLRAVEGAERAPRGST